uniref:Peptidase M20 dimerisation domain-containing protein n=2 Tax=Dunaliella tertiolecta TaxID=3047 RepID=A0A6S8GW75_DUNTE|mmetsp:Transcript_11767/g.32066  ORF Transcript_11767/g.32066 Transcript_11767/m.32066 type:complete len:437 (-) Transcript_11767:359-1669(-)|eukprot:CAMPEP_0202343030 /NCGR_PEP_ID=MMETSP1126-20121109/3334_1 /ASSEMBLY_ACC=CAM_ASM_000457 /TAXON_ID=3047 /ORGANISM="Dunaliella tertiolecta, Strain CCMP1320" /LENGTH=436 /DNA_ID=CAMNT_0048934057 /DNA_START=1664 /DNA_END=2974 /DNA_ORIENTATION=-
MAHPSFAFLSAILVTCLVQLSVNAVPPPPLPKELAANAKASSDWIVGLRRKLHATPELGGNEIKTSATIKAALDELGINYKDGYVGTGIVATIGNGAGPTVALRSDIDALPILEPEGLPFRSQHEGRMHACGHDSHMSMLLGAAKVLKAMEHLLPGTVRLVFQPNEEFGAGGDQIVQQGALDGVDAAFALHIWPMLPSGSLATRPGTIMAGALSFHIKVNGRGGHAAMPHLNADPIVAASAIISGMQTLVSRETSPLGSAVLSVTLLKAGSAYNVIPDVAEFGGTIRTLDHDTMVHLQGRLESLAAAIAAGFGCTTSLDWRLNEQPYYPPTVNDPKVAAMAAAVAAEVLGGEEHVVEAVPSMAGEDFAFFCRKVPCTLGFLGTKNESIGAVHGLHTPRFMLDESVLHKGAALHASWAFTYLSQAQSGARSADKEEL